MTKELKAFRKICKNLNGYGFTYECSQNKKLIETALEELEVKREVIGDILSGDDDKKLKVLKIIKEHFKIAKPVGVSIEKNAVGVGGLIQIKDLTIENYSLLKEVLL